MAAGDPTALLTSVKIPDEDAAVDGENCTVRVMLWEGDRDTADPPETDKFVPVKPTLEIATLELPVFVTVMFREAELPTVTFPKLTADGLIERLKPGAIPVPLSATEGELDALLANKRLPVEDPALFGSNWTLNELVWPA